MASGVEQAAAEDVVRQVLARTFEALDALSPAAAADAVLHLAQLRPGFEDHHAGTYADPHAGIRSYFVDLRIHTHTEAVQDPHWRRPDGE